MNWGSHLGRLEEGSLSPYFPSVMLGGKNPIALSLRKVLCRLGGGVATPPSPQATPLLTILRVETQTLLLDSARPTKIVYITSKRI